MKALLLMAIMATNLTVWAEDTAAPTASAKAAHKQARMDCLKENPALKGKALKACVTGKVAATK